MLRTARLLPPTWLSTLGFDAGRFPPTPPACYRAPWQLPGRDSHPLAVTSLRTHTIRPSGHRPPIHSRAPSGHAVRGPAPNDRVELDEYRLGVGPPQGP